MNHLKKAVFDEGKTLELDRESEQSYRKHVLARMDAYPSWKKEILAKLQGKGETALSNSLSRIEDYLDFMERHLGEDLEKLTGDDARMIPFLEYDPSFDGLVVVRRVSAAEKKRVYAINRFVVSDYEKPGSVVEHGARVLQKLKSLPPRIGKPTSLQDASEVLVRMSHFLKGTEAPRGILWSDADKNGEYLLDFAAFLGAREGRSTACLGASETLTELSMKPFKADALLESVNRAKGADVLCLYDVDRLPMIPNFIQTIVVPLLTSRKREGKITFAWAHKPFEEFTDAIGLPSGVRDLYESALTDLFDVRPMKCDDPLF